MSQGLSFVNYKKVNELNQKIEQRGYVDREHLLEFMTCIESNDAKQIIQATQGWLKALHDNPKYDKVTFPQGDIDAIISDLDSYGRVSPEHIMEFKQKSNKSLPVS